MDLSVVIPTWRGRHLLEAYLPSVLAAVERYQTVAGSRTEIVIVEDAGGDDTPEWLRGTHGDRVRLVEHERNLGFCGACRTCFETARFPLVLLLNNDVRLDPGCIAPMTGHFREPDVFAVTGRLFNQTGDTFCNGGKIGRFRRGMWSTWENYDLRPGSTPDGPLLSFTAIGAFSLYDRAKFLETGGFDDLTSMVEDVEISWHAWKLGWRVLYEPRAVAYHDASQTMDQRYRRRSLDKISRRSRILMHWMHLHDRAMFRQHLLAITGRLLTSWIYMDWRFYWAIGTGIANLGRIRLKREAARQAMRRSDAELLELLNRFYASAPILPRRV